MATDHIVDPNAQYCIWFDTETTGVIQNKDQVYELAYIITDNKGNQLDSDDIYMRPTISMHKEALAIAPVSEEFIYTLPERSIGEQKVRDVFMKWGKYNKLCCFGYNVNFDINMTTPIFKLVGDDILNYIHPYNRKQDVYKAIQTVSFNRCVGLDNNKLTTVAEYFKCTEANAHNALADIKMTINTHRCMKQWLLEEYIPNKEAYEEKVKYKLTDMMDIGKHKGKLISELIAADKSYLKFMVSRKFITVSDEIVELIKG